MRVLHKALCFNSRDLAEKDSNKIKISEEELKQNNLF